MFKDIEELNSKIAEFESNMNSTNGYIELFKRNLSLLEATSTHMHEASGTFDEKTRDIITSMIQVSDSIQSSNSEVVDALSKNSSQISDALKNEIAAFERNVNSTNGCVNLLKQNISLLEALSTHGHEARKAFDANATNIISRVKQASDTMLNSNSETTNILSSLSNMVNRIDKTISFIRIISLVQVVLFSFFLLGTYLI